MIRLSATPDETAALDAKFDACIRENWKLLRMSAPPRIPYNPMASIGAQVAMCAALLNRNQTIGDVLNGFPGYSQSAYNNQLAVDGQ